MLAVKYKQNPPNMQINEVTAMGTERPRAINGGFKRQATAGAE